MSETKLILPSNKQWTCNLSAMLKSIGNICIRHFQKSFELQRFNEEGSEPWKEVKRSEINEHGKYKYNFSKGAKQLKSGKGYTKGSKADRTNLILIGKGSGKLKKSFAITKINETGVTVETIGVAEAYASVHNEGLHAGKGKGFTMPKRQFAGDSKKLDEDIEKEILKHIGNLFK